MTTKEFIKRVEELGCRVRKVEFNDSFEVWQGDDFLGYVKEKRQHELGTNQVISEETLDLMVEYAKTPIAEREKKYYLRPQNKMITEEQKEALIEIGFDSSYFELA